ncbi:hypothetical protein B0H17DRAFT_261211 [Mycena rosella]|uniref:Uncharacterized protein n=1 Tax=Mycena rosella TaxID=1033263 RepID=A0AAD7CWD9_MYCRO|nr:hypothetical protein B0H17DRAFT_261211 [Mycena rosella]
MCSPATWQTLRSQGSGACSRTPLLSSTNQSHGNRRQSCCTRRSTIPWTTVPCVSSPLSTLVLLTQSFPRIEPQIEKVIKVEAAAFTLSNLAVSHRRRYLVRLNLFVHHIPLPPKGSVDLEIDKLQRWRPRTMEPEVFMGKVSHKNPRSTKTSTTVTTRTDSECELVARVLANGSTDSSPGFRDIAWHATRGWRLSTSTPRRSRSATMAAMGI